MEKINIGTGVFPCPMAVTLVGTVVGKKVNFMTVAWVTRVNANPVIWAVVINKKHFTPEGIKEKGTFSINFPDTSLVVKTDYCGIISGRKKDKSEIFEVFYGELKNAPMIKECPLCIECTLRDIIDLPTNLLVLGDVAGAYTEERYMTDGKMDIKKLNPLVLTMPDNNYWSVGEYVAKAWGAGKEFMKEDS